jgi:DNA (cytosine-5)-methyltransferase 1
VKALDLFCGAGGVSVGLQRAGFDVVGVDIAPQPNHRGGEFVQADALEYPLEGFDFIWASPPCQAFTAYNRRPDHVKESPDLIEAVRDRMEASGAAWAIENVVGAPLRQDLLLCGSMFGLDVRRHRVFELAFDVEVPPSCNHGWQEPRFPSATNRPNQRKTVEVGKWAIPLDVQRRAMGVPWMALSELTQAIPPAYAEYIGRAAMNALSRITGR